MNLLNQATFLGKVMVLLPGLMCLVIAFIIKKTNGRIIAGFNSLTPEKQDKLRNKNIVIKTFYLVLILSGIFVIDFILSFLVKDTVLFNNIFEISWFLFAATVIVGIIIINLSCRDK